MTTISNHHGFGTKITVRASLTTSQNIRSYGISGAKLSQGLPSPPGQNDGPQSFNIF